MPIPQELFFLVGWASCPSYQLRKRIFARGLIIIKVNQPILKSLPLRSVRVRGWIGLAITLATAIWANLARSRGQTFAVSRMTRIESGNRIGLEAMVHSKPIHSPQTIQNGAETKDTKSGFLRNNSSRLYSVAVSEMTCSPNATLPESISKQRFP